MSIQKTLVFLLCFMSACLPAWSQEYWLEFNPYAFSTEYFWEGRVKRGSCAAAAATVVAAHLELKSSIPSGAVKSANEAMKEDEYYIYNNTFYIFHINSISDRLNDLGFNAQVIPKGDANDAMDIIFTALSEKKWVIILARASFNTTSVGHFYPVYGGYEGVDASSSWINVIDTLAENNASWGEKYINNVSMDQVLRSMLSASEKNLYNILIVE